MKISIQKLKNNKKTTALVGGIIVVALAIVVGLVCCGNSVAATVGKQKIYEKDVTNYIEKNIREASGYTEDYMFAMFMQYYGYTPETLRETVIDMFVQEKLVYSAAEDLGIKVTDAEVDEQVAAIRAQVESVSSSPNAWETALSNAGLTEEAYRESMKYSLLNQRLKDSLGVSANPTDEEVLEVARTNIKYFDGAKRSSHILFNADEEELAQEVLDKINNGELTFEDAVDDYSNDKSSVAADVPGDVGWDCMTSFVGEYQKALDGLAVGEVSGLVTSSYGIHIIKCTDQYAAPSALTSLDQLPSEFSKFFTNLANTNTTSLVFNQWLNAYKSSINVVINSMPIGLSYNIDIEETINKYYESLGIDMSATEVETTTEADDHDHDHEE